MALIDRIDPRARTSKAMIEMMLSQPDPMVALSTFRGFCSSNVEYGDRSWSWIALTMTITDMLFDDNVPSGQKEILLRVFGCKISWVYLSSRVWKKLVNKYRDTPFAHTLERLATEVGPDATHPNANESKNLKGRVTPWIVRTSYGAI